MLYLGCIWLAFLYCIALRCVALYYGGKGGISDRRVDRYQVYRGEHFLNRPTDSCVASWLELVLAFGSLDFCHPRDVEDRSLLRTTSLMIPR